MGVCAGEDIRHLYSPQRQERRADTRRLRKRRYIFTPRRAEFQKDNPVVTDIKYNNTLLFDVIYNSSTSIIAYSTDFKTTVTKKVTKRITLSAATLWLTSPRRIRAEAPSCSMNTPTKRSRRSWLSTGAQSFCSSAALTRKFMHSPAPINMSPRCLTTALN